MGQQESSPPPQQERRSCCQQSLTANRKSDTVVVDGAAVESRTALASPTPPEHLGVRRRAPNSAFKCTLLETPGPEVEVTEICARMATVSWNNVQMNQPRKYHIYIVLQPSAGSAAAREPTEVAFFEADGAASSFTLPDGTLNRAWGPYCAEVIAEAGTADRPNLSAAGVSQAFRTPPEPPGRVEGLCLSASPRENEISVEWTAPLDDGGSPLDDYEIVLRVHEDEAWLSKIDNLLGRFPCAARPRIVRALWDAHGHTEMAALGLRGHREAVVAHGDNLGTESCVVSKYSAHTFSGLQPGAGPYSIEVNARNVAGLSGIVTKIVASTAVARPSIPTELTARMSQMWPSQLEARGRCYGLAADDDRDVDVVTLEFRTPLEDGGRALVCYRVYATPSNASMLDHGDVHEAYKKMVASQADQCTQRSMELLCEVSAEDVAPGEQLEAGSRCSFNVAVAPNCTYSFRVEASNGVSSSSTLPPQPSVFVPARVPMPPVPPKVTLQAGSSVAELRWEAPLLGGGLPLISFKIGVMGGRGDLGFSPEIRREVTVSVADAALAGCWEDDGPDNEDEEWVKACRPSYVQKSCSSEAPPTSLAAATKASAGKAAAKNSRAVCFFQVDGLEADARYCFLLASSNLVGTGRWSSPSSAIRTPVAAPSRPMNAVATVAPATGDDPEDQGVNVTISWECGRSSPGSGALQAFHVTLTRVAQHACSGMTAINERIPVSAMNSGQPGHRMSWVAALSQPGRYRVEIFAESIFGQRSSPAEISLEVRPETFPQKVSEPCIPHWAEEPVLFLDSVGSVKPSASSLAQELEGDTSKWLQTLLLWHDGDVHDGDISSSKARASSSSKSAVASSGAAVDVVCYFRRAGGGNSKTNVACLAANVTACRSQIVLPTHVPLSLRLLVRAEGPAAQRQPRVQSEPLLLFLSESGSQLKPMWEVWTRNSPDGQPPRWTAFPESVQESIEAAWVESQPKVCFDLQDPSPDLVDGSSLLAAGKYDITFGDDCRVQHCAKRLNSSGVPQWTANVRRTVLDEAGEDAAAPALPMEELCVICMERRRTHAFMHADTGDGHLAVCAACSEAFRAESSVPGAARVMRTCPMCRRSFTAVQRIYS